MIMTFPRYGCANRNSFKDPAEYLVELARVEEERPDKNDIKYIFPSSIQVNTLDPKHSYYMVCLNKHLA